MTPDEIRNHLKEKGREIGKYSQTSRIDNIPALQGAAAHGFCTGASLAWVQRVLCGGSAADGPGDRDAVASHLLQSPSTREAFINGRQRALQSAYKKSIAQEDLDLEELNQKADRILAAKLPSLSSDQKDAFFNQVNAAFEKNSAIVKARSQSQQNLLSAAMKKDALFDAFWKEFGKLVDAKLRTNNYSSLTVVRTSLTRVYGPGDGLNSFLREVLTGDALATGNAGVLVIFPPFANSSGHSVAVHRVSDQLYYFFDPNFGTYAADLRTLMWMFLFLFLKAYPSAGTSSDYQAYQVDGVVKGEYVIYKGPSKGHISSRVAPCDLVMAS